MSNAHWQNIMWIFLYSTDIGVLAKLPETGVILEGYENIIF